MELQSSSEEEHVYALDPATEEAIKDRRSKETVRSGGQGTKSLASSYMKIALFGTGGHLLSVAYWILISLSTSYNAELGSYSLSALYVSQIGSLFVAPSLINIIGSKACAVLSGLCGIVFAASYMYPCWYTIIPSSLLQGFACALMYATLVVTKNDEVRRVVVEKGVDEITYHGRFGAIGSVAFNSSAIVSGIITVATLSDQHNALGYHSNATSGDNDSVSYNATAQLILQSCATIASPTSGASANYTLNYYILVALCIVATILAVAIFSVGGGATYHPCRVFSFRLKSLLRDVATYAARVLKQATTPAYGMTLPLWLLMGLVTAYFFGVFTKMYITECVGVEFVGVSVIVWGMSSCLGSSVSGWLIPYTTSYIIVTAVLVVGHIGSTVFLLVWVRQPSFEVISIMAAIFGLCHGVIFAAALVYIGLAPGYSQEIGNCLVFIGGGIGNAVQFFLSEYITAEANLYALMTLSVIAVHLFFVADKHFGSGSGKRSCCGRQHVEKTVGGQPLECAESTDASSSSTVSEDSSVVINNNTAMVSDNDNGRRPLMRRESPV